jgi:hypothetical protein
MKVIGFVDRYIGDLDNEKKLDAETFKALASCVPKEKRDSFDKLTLALLDLLERGLLSLFLDFLSCFTK